MASEREVEITSDVIFEMFDSVKCGCGSFCYKRGLKQHLKSKKHQQWLINLDNSSDTASTSTTATRGRASR